MSETTIQKKGPEPAPMEDRTPGEPGAEELALIGKYTRRALRPEEVYTFPVVLCDNEVDREGERFSIPALEKLAELFVGKTGIFDHDPRGRNQTARVYRCRVDRDPGRTTAAGEPYCALRADAYMVRGPGTEALILEIDGGIKKEVSVGCAVDRAKCNICGADRRKDPCRHRPGETYDGALCHTVLEGPTDAYEWSFVAVPAQPGAGVVKQCRPWEASEAAPRDTAPLPRALEKALDRGEGLTLTPGEAVDLARWARALAGEAEEGRAFREKALGEAVRLGVLAHPGLDRELLEKTLRPLGREELERWGAAYRRGAAQRLPLPALQVQTAPPPREKSGAAINDSFKV